MGEKFLELYFDRVYNPIYDVTTATLSRYRALQERCLALLKIGKDERTLCVGLGTGNELVTLLARAPGLPVVGIDLSRSALERARRKTRGMGRPDLRIMDARTLDFADGSFDRVLCVHVLDFVDPVESVVGEILRVLRPGGRFVMTLPSDKEDASMGGALFGDQIRSSLRSGKHPLRLVLELLLLIPVGLLYLPLLFRPHRKAFTREQAVGLLGSRRIEGLEIEEERTYQDFILAGVRV